MLHRDKKRRGLVLVCLDFPSDNLLYGEWVSMIGSSFVEIKEWLRGPFLTGLDFSTGKLKPEYQMYCGLWEDNGGLFSGAQVERSQAGSFWNGRNNWPSRHGPVLQKQLPLGWTFSEVVMCMSPFFPHHTEGQCPLSGRAGHWTIGKEPNSWPRGLSSF